MDKWFIEVTIKVRASVDAEFRQEAFTIAQSMGQAVIQNPALHHGPAVVHCLTVDTVVEEDR